MEEGRREEAETLMDREEWAEAGGAEVECVLGVMAAVWRTVRL